MKKPIAFLLALVCVLALGACGDRTLDDISADSPSITGIVEEVRENDILIACPPMAGYPSGAKCSVSLDVENKDSMTQFRVGDEVVVYYDGQIAESYPMQIHTVYTITLKTPVN